MSHLPKTSFWINELKTTLKNQNLTHFTPQIINIYITDNYVNYHVVRTEKLR